MKRRFFLENLIVGGISLYSYSLTSCSKEELISQPVDLDQFLPNIAKAANAYKEAHGAAWDCDKIYIVNNNGTKKIASSKLRKKFSTSDALDFNVLGYLYLEKRKNVVVRQGATSLDLFGERYVLKNLKEPMTISLPVNSDALSKKMIRFHYIPVSELKLNRPYQTVNL